MGKTNTVTKDKAHYRVMAVLSFFMTFFSFLMICAAVVQFTVLNPQFFTSVVKSSGYLQSCQEILEETLVSYYNIFKEKNIVPKVSICSKKIYKTANRISIIRIFENILSNVSKYSTGDFKVIMNEDGIISFSNKANSLDATTVQKIFERYFSVENAKESTGIGLSIAKKLIELNDGTIKAEYKKGNLIIEIKL